MGIQRLESQALDLLVWVPVQKGCALDGLKDGRNPHRNAALDGNKDHRRRENSLPVAKIHTPTFDFPAATPTATGEVYMTRMTIIRDISATSFEKKQLGGGPSLHAKTNLPRHPLGVLKHSTNLPVYQQ
jgi:hypothetical protein